MDVHIGYEAGANVTAGDNIGIGRSAGRGYHGVGQVLYGQTQLLDIMYPSVVLQEIE